MNTTKSKPVLHRKDYAPVPGFFDLRSFELSASEFVKAWRIQLFLRSIEDRKALYKRSAPLSWSKALEIGAELQVFLMSRLRSDRTLE
jgi:hypothetical protein